jgi:hypothetical protein
MSYAWIEDEPTVGKFETFVKIEGKLSKRAHAGEDITTLFLQRNKEKVLK